MRIIKSSILFFLKCLSFSIIFYVVWLTFSQRAKLSDNSSDAVAKSQVDSYERQVARVNRQLDVVEAQQKRMDANLQTQEVNSVRLDAVLKVWEKQTGLRK
jgi:hypothetical protein